jgi:hypothetical protein
MKINGFFSAMMLFSAVISGSCKKDISTQGGQPLQSSEWLVPGDNAPVWQNKNIDGIGPAQVLEITDPAITPELIKNSVVLVYGNLGGYPAAIRQPGKVELMRLLVSYIRGNNPRTDVWSGMPVAGKMLIMLTNPDNEYDPYGNAPGHIFRYFFVPKYDPNAVGKKPAEGASTLLAKYSEDDLRNMTYEQFCEAAGVKK